jgi:hypothetical protein
MTRSEGFRRERLPRTLPALVSVGALAVAIAHLVWPDVEIDSVTLVLLLVAIAPWLAPIFKSIELPGGYKFEFQEFKRVVEQDLAEKTAQVETLANRVEKVEALVFTGGTTPAQEQQLTDAVERFREYLRSIGFSDPRQVAVRLVEGEDNAYYDGGKNEIVLDAALAADPDVIYREYGHHVLLADSPAESFGALGEAAAIVESGLADYLVCSFTGSPVLGERAAEVFRERLALGESYRSIRDLANDLRFGDVERGAAPQIAGAVWGGFFWDLRERLGRDVVDPLLVRAWQASADFGRSVVSRPFARRVVAEAETVGTAEADAARELLRKRGVRLSG